MSRVAYVNGSYRPLSEAAVHIEDRGYQFGDGVYEVVLVRHGRLHDLDGHLARLDRSLKEIFITPPVGERALRLIMARLVRLNRLVNGIIYLQITRGVARRDHKFPADTEPSLVLTTKSVHVEAHTTGKAAITVKDERWARRDVKTIQLLPNCLAKQAASAKGAYEAIMVMPDGTISEGSSSNLWMVTPSGELITRQADHDILNGITRRAIMKLAEERQMPVIERPFTVAEALAAKELFVTSATSIAMPIIRLDDQEIGDGSAGEVALHLRSAYLEDDDAV